MHSQDFGVGFCSYNELATGFYFEVRIHCLV